MTSGPTQFSASVSGDSRVTEYEQSAGFPPSPRRFCQMRFSASPPGIAASLEPVV